MINKILDLIKLLAAAAPTLALCLAADRLNVKRPYRVRQFLMPILAFIYVIGTMIFYKQICDGIMALINNLPMWLHHGMGHQAFL